MLIDEQPSYTEITDTPDLEELRRQLQQAITEAGVYLDQYRFDFETRYCLWDGQSRDGRKWQDNIGTNHKVRPWDGASDVRTFTADEICNEQVDVMMSAFNRAQFQVTALRSDQLDWSTKITQLLQWYLRGGMAQELDREVEMAAQWRQMYGLSVLGVWWRQEFRMVQAVITLQEMLQMAMQQMQQGNPLPLQSLADPLQDERTVSEMVKRSPILDRSGAKKILRNLRSNGQAEVPRLTVTTNQPCWEALRAYLDVFFPTETSTLQRARWVQRRRLLTLPEIEFKVNSGEWDREWAQELATMRGKSYSMLNDYRDLPLRRTETMLSVGSAIGLPNEAYCEVWDGYYYGLDKKTGMPVMQHVVWSPLLEPNVFGRFEAFGYDHGQMPFVELVRERVERSLSDSRSIGEIAATHQRTIKTQTDADNDLAQLTTVPPLCVPMWRAGAEVPLGPAAQVPEKVPNELRWMSPPAQTGAGERARMNADMALGRYFGLMREGVDPRRTQAAQERLTGKFLREIGAACRQTLQLCQQYMSDVDAEMVVGAMRMPFHVSREEIQGEFNLMLHYDPTQLNPDLVVKKLEAFEKYILAFDNQGVVNRAKLAEMGARMLDPWMADALVGSPEAASQGEVEDEKQNLASIMAGVEPPMRPEGQNYQLRLQTLLQEVKANPYLPARLAAQPDSAAMLDARLKHLAVMAEQFGINKQIGRTGAAPGLEQIQAKMDGGGPVGAAMANGGGQ